MISRKSQSSEYQHFDTKVLLLTVIAVICTLGLLFGFFVLTGPRPSAFLESVDVYQAKGLLRFDFSSNNLRGIVYFVADSKVGDSAEPGSIAIGKDRMVILAFFVDEVDPYHPELVEEIQHLRRTIPWGKTVDLADLAPNVQQALENRELMVLYQGPGRPLSRVRLRYQQ